MLVLSYTGIPFNQSATPPVERQKIVIKKSVFEDNSLLFQPNEFYNSYEDVGTLARYGMIRVERSSFRDEDSRSDLKIVNTVFRNNQYGDDTIIVSLQNQTIRSLALVAHTRFLL